MIEGRTGQWETVIGLEVHAQVVSRAKLFSGAATEFGAEPNTQVSPVDGAFPGMLPVINRFCIEQQQQRRGQIRVVLADDHAQHRALRESGVVGSHRFGHVSRLPAPLSRPQCADDGVAHAACKHAGGRRARQARSIGTAPECQ